MSSPNITLEATIPGSGILNWSSTSHLRIGRISELEIVLHDDSISRRHAEIVLTNEGWVVRDLGSSNGTFLNGTRIGRTGQRIRASDTIAIGRIQLRITRLRERIAPAQPPELNKTMIPGLTHGLADAFGQGQPRDISPLIRLLRGGHRLSGYAFGNVEMQNLLDDARVFFGAQRAGLLFAVQPMGALELRFASLSPDRPTLPRTVSNTAAKSAFQRKESVLFKDTQRSIEFAKEGSADRSATASILGAVIRSQTQSLGVLQLERGVQDAPFTEGDLFLADALADALAVGLERLQMQDAHQDLMVQSVTALAQAVEMRDQYTGNHTNRVSTYSLLLAEELGLPDDQRKLLRVSSALHDIGKIAIDDQILRKPGKLTDDEFEQMKAHVTRGAEIIETIPGLAWALPVVRSHHERWDGAGYPDELAGERIPMNARIVAVADTFDAMTSDRPYRRGLPSEVAFDELRACAGKQFDPECVRAFLNIRKRIEAMLDDEKLFHLRAETAGNTKSIKEVRLECPDRTSFPPNREVKITAHHKPGSQAKSKSHSKAGMAGIT